MKKKTIHILTIMATLCFAIALFGCGNGSGVKLTKEINYGQAVVHAPESATTSEEGGYKSIATDDIKMRIDVIDADENETEDQAQALLDKDAATFGTPSTENKEGFKKITFSLSDFSADCDGVTKACEGYAIFLCQENQSYLFLIYGPSSSSSKLKPTIDAIADSATIDSSLDIAKTIESIEAIYGGSDKAGTTIDSSSDITVTAVYDDGTSEDVEGWTIESPQTLEAGKTAEVKISYNGLSASLYVKCISIKSVKASYSGSTKAGTTIDSDSDITLTAVYDDESTEEIEDWTIKSPKTLKAGETAKVKVTFEGGSATLSIKCTSKTKAQKKAEYKDSCKAVGYKSVARNPEKYSGKKIKISGKVLQVSEGSYGINSLRVATSGGYDNVYLVSYDSSELSQNIIEDDKVTIWGECTGTTSYTTVLGASITIPSMDAKYFSIS